MGVSSQSETLVKTGTSYLHGGKLWRADAPVRPHPMSDSFSHALEIVGVVVVTAGLAMAVLMWRVWRIHNPPEFRWPKKHRRRSRSTRSSGARK
jgi:hypothetical protein